MSFFASDIHLKAFFRVRLPVLLDWLVRQDARHRQAHRIEALSDHILRDIGVTREQLLGR